MDLKQTRIDIIENYIEAYNRFDADRMCENLSSEVIFENISGGNVELRIEGIENFRNQANLATAYFSERKQSIDKWIFDHHIISVEISYEGILATDFPNGMKKGEVFRLKGISEFTFEHDKIIFLKDKS